MSTLLLAYLVVGMLYSFLEYRTLLAWDTGSRKEEIIHAIQLVVHMLRVWVTWPLYLIEDFTIWLLAEGGE